MKKFLLSFFFIVTFAVYSITEQNRNPMPPALVQNKSVESSTAEPTVASVPVAPVKSPTIIEKAVVFLSNDDEAPVPKAAPKKAAVAAIPPAKTTTGGMMNGGGMGMGMMGAYKDGQYTGSVADAYYGNVEVKAVISGGKISDVQFLQYPNDRRHSLELSNYAMPQLKSEAIAVQSAEVDVVSGASDTSAAFKESLAAALAKAKNT